MQTTAVTYALHTLDRDATERFIRRFWAERLVDSEAAIRRHTAPDIKFRVLGAPGSCVAPLSYDDQEAVVAAVRGIDTNLEFLSFDIVDLVIDGPRVALRWHASLQHRGTGVCGDLAVFDLIVLHDGKIVSYSEFLDTDGFQRLMAGVPQPMAARRSNRFRPPRPMVGQRDSQSACSVGALELRDRNEDALRAFWLRRFSGDGAALSGHFTEDCELNLIGDSTTVPFARYHMGREAVSQLIDQIEMEFEFTGVSVKEVLVEGDRAAVQWFADVRHRGTGARGRVEAFDHVVMRDGQVMSLTEVFDTAAAASWIEG